MDTWTLRARWIFPVSGPPIPNGLVVIAEDRIVSVEPAGSRSADVDLGNAAVLPGLVNAHTHLDLTGMRGLAPPSPDFTGWLRQVIAHRRGRTPEQLQADIRAGLAESIRAGVVLLGDISGDGSSWDVLKDAPVRAVVFRELLGLTKQRAKQALQSARAWMKKTIREAPIDPIVSKCRPGVSPHAPYSVRKDLLRGGTKLAYANGCALAIHLAESLAEIELLSERRGPFVSFLEEMGVWDSEGLANSLFEVWRECHFDTPKLFIHCNYLTPDFGFSPRCSVIYCPRTHAAFGHARHPFRELLWSGVRVALATDSLASNPDLDVLAEVRFLHQLHPDLPGDLLLRMITLSGAEALGYYHGIGSLDPNKSADLAVVPLASTDGEPHRLVLESPHPVRAVLFRGKWVHDSSGKLAPAFS